MWMVYTLYTKTSCGADQQIRIEYVSHPQWLLSGYVLKEKQQAWLENLASRGPARQDSKNSLRNITELATTTLV